VRSRTRRHKGIGFETARLLAARDVTVLVGARDRQRGQQAERALRTSGADAHHVELDVTNDGSIAQAAARIERGYGKLDILVNNAGIARGDGTGLPSETTLATLREVFETNVFGIVAVTNAMLPLLRRAPAARVVNVSSEVGSITSMTSPDSPMWPMASVTYPATGRSLLNR
jgi:NAD(P)-dependent dehydrogenase (short-subunit alcohol dehydrogenase family)